MASSFNRWEKDPFFNAAEEVQESADRVESIYRTWIHAVKDASCPWNSVELRRDLHTALGTAKLQVIHFIFAVKDECYDKPLHRWYGAFQRQLQRSQYQMQYNRPVQMTVWIAIIICFIVLIAFCAM